jgi:hypothetical protein
MTKKQQNKTKEAPDSDDLMLHYVSPEEEQDLIVCLTEGKLQNSFNIDSE